MWYQNPFLLSIIFGLLAIAAFYATAVRDPRPQARYGMIVAFLVTAVGCYVSILLITSEASLMVEAPSSGISTLLDNIKTGTPKF